MSTPTFVDTLFIVALLDRRDQYHRLAMDLSELYDGEPLITTGAVLLEVADGLARGARENAAGAIHNLLTSEHITVVHLTPRLFEEGLALYESRRDQDWGLTDCISFVVMRQQGIADALTFDQHFVQAGFRALMRD